MLELPWRLVPLGLLGIAVLAVAGPRARNLVQLVRSGQPNAERFKGLLTTRSAYAFQKIILQKKLLQRPGPGAAHALTFWGFMVIQVALIESVLEFFSPTASLPFVGHFFLIGTIFDFFCLAVAISLIAFAIIRVKDNPKIWQRKSRFYESHMGPAYLILFLIFCVVTTLLAVNSMRAALDHLPYANGAFISRPVGHWLAAHVSEGALETLEYWMLFLHVAVVGGFLILVLNSKHLHIFTSLISVPFARHPIALGALKPLHIDIETMDEDTKIGAGVVEDLEWKHLLDQLTCTECGRCQSVCPAWNTGKELNPKLLIMNLRDHAMAKMPVLTGKVDAEHATGEAKVACEQSLVGDVITPDVLWACVTCGACVYECPVDIEHVDMIVEMRRNQVMMESAFPREAQGMLNNVESSGNPWGIAGDARMQWAKGMEEKVPVIGAGQPIPDDVEYLFFVGCAGASDDRAIKTTRAVATLLDRAGVKFAVLGPQETCNGDPARRIGNEFLFQELAQANVEKFNATGVKKIITQCPHCFNTFRNEYPDYGGLYDVVHHAQLLAELIGDGKLKPTTPIDALVTYHDPCYLVRHNDVLDDPRHVITATGARQQDMHRCGKRTFCCGAGGARFFMEETEGKRINVERIEEALGTNADIVGTSCPFCLVMLDDGVKDKQMGGGYENVEVMDVANLLLRSMNGSATKVETPPETPDTPPQPAETSG
jgi:Fe-S oxidoreductase